MDADVQVSDEAVIRALEAIRIEVAALRHDLAAGRATGRISPPDAELLARLLPAIGGQIGSEPFRCRDLLDEAALLPLLCGMSPVRLGRLFARVVDMPLDGYVVQRVKAPGGTAMWSVMAIRPGE